MIYRGTIAYRTGLGSKVDEGFCASLVAAWDFLVHAYQSEYGEETELLRFHFMRGLSCMLEDSANQIADGFLGDWVIFLDTDHVFSSDALYNMVTTFEDNKLDILTGFAQQRQPPYFPLISKTDFDPLKPFTPIIPTGIERQTLIPIDSAGLACLMVRRKIFDDIKFAGERPFDMRPKFNTWGLAIKAPLHSMNLWDLPEGRHFYERYWEDVSFFWRAKMLGYQAYCAPWIKFHHLEQRLVNESMIQQPLDPRIPNDHSPVRLEIPEPGIVKP